jgi:hypothetical protein
VYAVGCMLALQCVLAYVCVCGLAAPDREITCEYACGDRKCTVAVCCAVCSLLVFVWLRVLCVCPCVGVGCAHAFCDLHVRERPCKGTAVYIYNCVGRVSGLWWKALLGCLTGYPTPSCNTLGGMLHMQQPVVDDCFCMPAGLLVALYAAACAVTCVLRWGFK